MELTEHEIIQEYDKQCKHCSRITLHPYEYECICIACGYNVIKRKNELSNISSGKTNFINRLQYSENSFFALA